MFKSLADDIKYPQWATERYKRLDMLDRVLDGTLYDHLENDFYTEETYNGQYIPLQKRRPSVNSAFASQIVGVLARKLFTGKHAPNITHDNKEYEKQLKEIVAQGSVFEKMTTAMYFGSVGSVAVTFRIIDNALRLDVWRAKNCYPVFGAAGEFAALRVCYTINGAEVRSMGFTHDNRGEPFRSDEAYWFLREYNASEEITFHPMLEDDWNPVENTWEELNPGIVISHGLGFMPGVWIPNMPGGMGYDGLSTFGSIVNNIIEMDYTISQLGRGIRYSAAPQLVVIGDNDTDDILRGPTTVLKLKAAYADDSQKMGGADAKLLEMVGNGTQVGINYIQELRRITFEALSASVKKHEMKGTMSGRAMEISDDAFYDLASMFRNTYGDSGLIPLVSKIVVAMGMTGAANLVVPPEEATKFGLRWPKLYPSTPADDIQMVESLVMAVQNGLLDADIAKSFLYSQMDLEDYRVQTPPQTSEGGATPGTPGVGDEDVLKDDKYVQGGTIDPRRPGPQGHMLPRRTVGGKQQTLD